MTIVVNLTNFNYGCENNLTISAVGEAGFVFELGDVEKMTQ